MKFNKFTVAVGYIMLGLSRRGGKLTLHISDGITFCKYIFELSETLDSLIVFAEKFELCGIEEVKHHHLAWAYNGDPAEVANLLFMINSLRILQKSR